VGRKGYQREPAGLFYEARAQALAGTGEGMLLDDALRHFRQRR
jgi:hypothetical protein